MDIGKIDTTNLEFTTEELDALGSILIKAEEIKNDKTLHSLVTKHMTKHKTKIESLEDLKNAEKNINEESED